MFHSHHWIILWIIGLLLIE